MTSSSLGFRSMVKRVGVAISCLVVLVAVAWGAAAWGYLAGGPQFQARFVPGDAAYTVAILHALRRGDSAAATSLLESHLDTQIVQHSLFDPELASWLDLSPLVLRVDAETQREVVAKLMKRVAAYRAKHPSGAKGPVLDRIEGHLATFQPEVDEPR